MDDEFTERFAGATGTYADPQLIDRNLERLATSAADIKDYVDRHLAHSDQNPMAALPTFELLNGAIDQLGAMFKKYALLLTGSSWGTLVPVIQYDWLAPFKEPWLLPQHESAVRAME